MSTNIYVGNLPFSATQEEVEELFKPFGAVESVNLITDRETGRLKGFGFVEMTDGDQAQAAMDGLNQHEMNGRTLTVNPAKPREERRPRQPRRY